MRNILIRLFIGIIAFLIVYLLIALVTLTLDITKWSEENRVVLSLFGAILSLLSSTAPYSTKNI